MAIEDVNKDGVKDLAVVTQDTAAAIILLGIGDGSFPSTPSASFENCCQNAIVVADFNGDGTQDLALIKALGNSVTILLGRGDGTFTIGSTTTRAPSPSAMVTADFNGDGKPDLSISKQSNVPPTIL